MATLFKWPAFFRNLYTRDSFLPSTAHLHIAQFGFIDISLQIIYLWNISLTTMAVLNI